jgi:hypothetical protein
MPLTGSATYTLIGGTRPTYVDGSTGPGTLLDGNLSVTDWLSSTISVNLSVSMPDGKGYAIGGTAQVSGSLFTGIRSFGEGTLTTSGSGGACSSECNALVTGFFAGTSAERAGLGYHIEDPLANKDVIGAAAFAKQ